MCYFRYEDKQIYYEESGEGTPLVLLHGNTACGKMFDPVVPALSEKYRVIVPDFLGNGRSIILDLKRLSLLAAAAELWRRSMLHLNIPNWLNHLLPIALWG